MATAGNVAGNTARRELVALPEFMLERVERLQAYQRNPRTHSPSQIKKLVASVKEFGWTVPILVDADRQVIAGHGRLEAARKLGLPEVPVLVLEHLTAAQRRAYVIADNQLALEAGWDDELLAQELKALEDLGSDLGFDLQVTGFDRGDIDDLFASLAGDDEADDDEQETVPEAPAEPTTRAGDVWVLGGHRLMCGDSTIAEHVAELVGDVRAQLVHADPPYGMGKEKDGVENDNLYAHELDAFQLKWWRAWRPYLEPNGSAYIWGNAPDLWRLWWRAGLADSEPMTLRNEIVWDKKSIAGMASPQVTQYPEASERCLFIQLGRHVFRINQTKDDYWQGWEAIRLWLVGERDRMKWTARRVREICGNHMQGHWFGTSQWVFISRDNYEKLAAAAEGQAFARPYDELKADYDARLAIFNGEVRGPRFEEFAAARPFFDNAHDVMRDVWEFPRVTGADRHGHATPKPVAMMERVMRSSLRAGQVCLEPFGGSGATLIGAEKTGRRCFAMELTPAYCDVIVKRWQELTGKSAVLAETGETFAELEVERRD
jgi:DNA modification methylase